MSSILITSVPIHGHVTPLLAVATDLVAHGHRVRFMTGARFAEKVAATGATYLPLPPSADYDDTDFDASFPDRAGLKGIASLRFDVEHIFLGPMPDQLAAVDRALLEEQADVILTEPLFTASAALAMRPRQDRPALVALGVVPLMMESRELAPGGMGLPPMDGLPGRIRNAALRLLTQRVVLGKTQRTFERMVLELTGREPGVFFLGWLPIADAIVQFTVPSFEYPHPDATVPVHFAGPVSRGASVPRPEWWHDLDGHRVVHVTQGTLANQDLTTLIVPTIRALAEEDVLVVVSLGGRPVGDLELSYGGALPANVRAATMLPYDELLPRTDVMVTNGGYGGVHFALQHGVPLVVAGTTEDKAETNARVAWSGAGVDLRTDRPSEQRIAAAVREVLANGRFAAASASIGAEIAAAPGLSLVRDVIDEVAGVPRS
jgi:UDP:flavonoid glycosyltransferase YjiC (YdhE family)